MLGRRRGVGYYCTCSCLTLHIMRRPQHCITSMSRWTKQFQLTPPVKDATPSKWNLQNMDKVSTHASREGRDRLSPKSRPTKPFQLTRPVKDATVYQESTDMITLSGRVCATVRGGVGLMGLCGAEAREFTGAVRCADIWGFLCELGARASVLDKQRRPVRRQAFDNASVGIASISLIFAPRRTSSIAAVFSAYAARSAAAPARGRFA